MVDNIESNVNHALAYVETGQSQLGKAQESQKAARKVRFGQELLLPLIPQLCGPVLLALLLKYVLSTSTLSLRWRCTLS